MTTGRVVITGGAVLAAAGPSYLYDQAIVVEDGLITAIVPSAGVEHRGDDTKIDATGLFIVPGLIDAHFHLVSRSEELVDEELVAAGLVEGVVNARERLRGGVTTVRDAGCRHRGVFALRRAIELGLVPGPRAYLAGTNPTGPRAPRHWRNVVVQDADEMRTAIDAQLDAGADWVKCVLAHAEDPTEWDTVDLYLDEDELRAAVETAHARGARIGVHCEGRATAALAVRCGVDVLDHAPLIDEPTAEAMADAGTVYVPTLWAFSDDAGIDLASLAPARRTRIEYWRAEHRASIARAHELGVTIAAGSDAVGSLPASDVLVNEMEALGACGLEPRAAFEAATIGAARAIGATERIGILCQGARADLVGTTSDPLVGLAVLRDPALVIARGGVVAGSRYPSLGPSTDELAVIASAFSGSTDRWAADGSADG
jgi:imidazolonepropionase-like amidohydrolase